MPQVLLVIEPVGQRQQRSLEEGQAAYAQMLAFADELRAAGRLRATNSLRADGVQVEVRAGRTRVIDGPFAEVKEFVGGFFWLDGTSWDEAVAIAARCPAAAWARVEVREVAACWEDSAAAP